MIIVLSAILAFISFPFLMSFACMDAGMGPGGLGCLGVGIGYTIVAFIVFVILGVMLNYIIQYVSLWMWNFNDTERSLPLYWNSIRLQYGCW